VFRSLFGQPVVFRLLRGEGLIKAATGVIRVFETSP
jgi:hypothetical protein